MSTDATPRTEVVYPESDGKPMADNTLQWEWMVKIVGELREASPQLFVPSAADGQTLLLSSPARYTQIVFDQLRPEDTDLSVHSRFMEYDAQGIAEYYLIDVDRQSMTGYVRGNGGLSLVWFPGRHVSPYFGVQFRYRYPHGFTAFALPHIRYSPSWVRYHDSDSFEVIETQLTPAPSAAPAPLARPSAAGC